MSPQPDQLDRPIIDPKFTALRRGGVAERMLLFPLEEHLNAYLARTGADRSRKRRFGPSIGYFPPIGEGRPGAIGPFMGAPTTAALAEELIAGGAKELVFFGIAGSIEPSFRIGDCAVAAKVFTDEGVSRHYYTDRDVFSGDDALSRRLLNHLAANGLSPRTANIWTTDAIYRETPRKVQAHAQAGRSLVEMEISALFSVAAFHRTAAAAFTVVSDELFTGKWKPGFLYPRYRLALIRSIKALAIW